METATRTLTAYLLDRITEDESEARHMAASQEHVPGSSFVAYYAGVFNTDRVLADCAARRRIVEDCEELLTKDVEYNERFGRASLARGFLHTLVLPYAEYEGFDPAWLDY